MHNQKTTNSHPYTPPKNPIGTLLDALLIAQQRRLIASCVRATHPPSIQITFNHDTLDSTKNKLKTHIEHTYGLTTRFEVVWNTHFTEILIVQMPEAA
jgi:hypothetical protein